jgi:2-alkenal reductase
MSNRTFRIVVVAILVALGVIALRPTIENLLFAATTPRAVQARGALAEFEQLTIGIFERVSPSVVQVAGRGGEGMTMGGATEDVPTQTGTGFIWDQAGHIVTNEHVVQGANTLAVRFASGEVTRANVVGGAPNYDLAVVRVTGVKLPAPIPVGTSADLKVGQAAYAIGNPFGLDQSLTSGIISALRRRLPTTTGREITNVIQTDAAINPGNSGGPLLDSAGRLIGVNTAIFSPSGSNAGIGFAIPVDTVNRVVPELIRTGHFPTPGIGITTASEAAATRMGVEGVVVLNAVPGSPAARAGLRGINPTTRQLGDVIVGVDDKPVHRLADLTDYLEQVGVGKSVELTLDRGGSKTKVKVDVVDVTSR